MPELSCSDLEALLRSAVDENNTMERETRHFRRYMDVHMPKALVNEIRKCALDPLITGDLFGGAVSALLITPSSGFS